MKTIQNVMLAAAGIICLLSSCKEKSSRSTQLSYAENQCANPWEYGNSQNDHENNILAYLAANGVNATNIELEISEDSMIVCLACTCPSNVTVNIDVEDEDIAEANSLGFY